MCVCVCPRAYEQISALTIKSWYAVELNLSIFFEALNVVGYFSYLFFYLMSPTILIWTIKTERQSYLLTQEIENLKRKYSHFTYGQWYASALQNMKLPSPFATNRIRYKVNFKEGLSWFEFRVFLLIDELPQELRLFVS